MEWKEENGRLKLEIDYTSQTELAEQLIKVARLADQMNHHPDITVRKAFHLTLELWTHSAGKITDKDRKLADKIIEAL